MTRPIATPARSKITYDEINSEQTAPCQNCDDSVFKANTSGEWEHTLGNRECANES